jgi:hypothetical protein
MVEELEMFGYLLVRGSNFSLGDLISDSSSRL